MVRMPGVVLCVLVAGVLNAQDGAVSPYAKGSAVSATLSFHGSTTVQPLVKAWVGEFGKHHPSFKAGIDGKSSGAAIPALIEGKTQIGMLSRPPKDAEIAAFEAKFGCKPLVLRVAKDAIALYVNKICPVEEVSLEQLDALYSKTRKRGAAEDVTTWGQLGAKGSWASKPIVLHGRTTDSGTYEFFKENVLKGGDFKDTVKAGRSATSVVLAITTDPSGLAYGSVGEDAAGLRQLKLSDKAGSPAVGPAGAPDNYPLSRYLYLAVHKAQGKPLDPAVAEFLSFVFSTDGQAVVAREGNVRLPDATGTEEVARIR